MPIPRFAPLELSVGSEPVDDPDWLYELKYDGFRALLYLENGKAELVSRNGNVYTRFNELREQLATDIRLREGILDGEIVCLDDQGRPQFDALFYRRGRPVFVAFDLLWMNGTDYRQRPLMLRKSRLSIVVPLLSDSILQAHHVLERGVDLYREACRLNLEGIVAKHGQSPYGLVKGRSPWIKIRNPEYSQKEGRREQFDRLRKPKKR